ncbi:MAG: PEP-CTERM sorting domain-containing protein [Pseudomonadota bacterium]|nr:PEP-CTERM sorting domain-containing protein [Pseudomonadota bacterium]
MQHTIDLNEQLTRYGITAKGQIAQGRSLGEYAGYAAAVGAGLAMAGGADAAIIYSGVQNISLSLNPAAQAATNSIFNVASQNIDMDGGGADFGIQVGFVGQLNTGSTAAKYVGGGILQGAGSALWLNAGSASNLAAGAMVGPGGNFAGGNVGRVRFQVVNTVSSSATTNGNFADGVTGFVGIKLASGNYGWIRLRLDDLGINQPFSTLLGAPLGAGLGFPDKITVIDWAYQTSGGAIQVGDTVSQTVPEPSSLALLAAGAAGLAAFRRRKTAQAEAR